MATRERGKPLTLPNALERQILTTSRFTGPTVTIEVGATDKVETHTIHADILEKQSPFWKSALKKCWEEGAKGKIKLPEDDRDAVGTYLEWIYSAQLEISWLSTDQMTENQVDAEFEHLARVYVFGEKLQDNLFCNRTMDAILNRATGLLGGRVYCYSTTKAIGIIYDGTPEGSPARQLCVFLHTHYGLSQNIKSLEEGEHPDFLRDLTRSMMDARGYPQQKFDVGKWQTWYKTA